MNDETVLKNKKLVSDLEQQIEDLKEFDLKLEEVSNIFIKEIIDSRKNKEGVPFKSPTRNPEYLNAISSIIKSRTDTKKAIIKAILDETNLVNKLGEYETSKDDQSKIFEAVSKAAFEVLQKENKKEE